MAGSVRHEEVVMTPALVPSAGRQLAAQSRCVQWGPSEELSPQSRHENLSLGMNPSNPNNCSPWGSRAVTFDDSVERCGTDATMGDNLYDEARYRRNTTSNKRMWKLHLRRGTLWGFVTTDRQSTDDSGIQRDKAINSRKKASLREIGPREVFRNCLFLDRVQQEALVKWCATIVISIAISLTASFIILTSQAIVNWKLHVMERLFRSAYVGLALFLWVGYGIVSNLIATLLVNYLAPAAGGSGLPDVKAYLNGNILPGTLSFWTLLCRVAGLLLVTSSGLIAGMQGPMAHIGAMIAVRVSAGRSRLCGCRLRFAENLDTHKAKLEFMSQGAAVGVAAAFGTPIGGLLFSMEEASTFWTPQLTWRIFLSACLASLIGRAFRGFRGGFPSVRLQGFIEFPDQNVTWELWEFIPFAFIGISLGLVGACFCRCMRLIHQRRIRVFRLRQKGKLRKGCRVAETIVVATATMLVTFWLSWTFECSGMENRATGGHDQLRLFDSESISVGTVLLQSRERAITSLFSRTFPNGDLPEWHLAMLFAVVVCLTLFTNGLSVPGGIFTPNIMAGACFGRLVGQAVDHSGYAMTHVHAGVYALMGSAAMVAGVTRLTVSLGVIILEITGNTRLIIPLMFVIMTAKTIADRFTPAATDIMIALRNIPMLEPEAEKMGWREMSKIPISCCGTEVGDIEAIYLNEGLRASDAAKMLYASAESVKYHAWPVLDSAKSGRLQGLLMRQTLVECMEHDGNKASCHELLKLSQAEEGIAAVELPIPKEHMLEIEPFIDRRPFVMLHYASLLNGYRVFRSLGLRHLCVVDEKHRLCCIVTRTDFAEIVEEFVNPCIMDMRDFADSAQDGTLCTQKTALQPGLSRDTTVNMSAPPSLSSGTGVTPTDGTSATPMMTRRGRRQRRITRRATYQNAPATAMGVPITPLELSVDVRADSDDTSPEVSTTRSGSSVVLGRPSTPTVLGMRPGREHSQDSNFEQNSPNTAFDGDLSTG